MKISTASGTLQVADYFNMSNTVSESGGDVDLGSGGAMVLPDLNYGTAGTLNLAVGAGKDGNIYVVNRNNMGKCNANSNNVYQELPGAVPNGVWGVPAYFNNTVYYCDAGLDSEILRHRKRKTFRHAGSYGGVLHLSRRAAQRLGQRHFERHRLGHRKYGHGSPARLRRK